MSYEKQTWQTGDVVTSAKLNHMEDGIAAGGGVFVVHAVYDEQIEKEVFDKTYAEVISAVQSGLFPLIINADENYASVYLFSAAFYDEDTSLYTVVIVSGDYSDRSAYTAKYTTDSADGYPSF